MKYTKTKDVKSPVRANPTDAGIDFFVPNDFGAVTLEPGQDILIDAGIKVIVPEGYALIFKEKSGYNLCYSFDVSCCRIYEFYNKW